MAAKRNSC